MPRGGYAVTQPVDVASTSLGYAIVFSLLTAVAFALSSFHTWECYSIGNQISGVAVARWKTQCTTAFLFFFVVSWFGNQVQNQANLRRLNFHEMFGKSGPGL